MVAFVVVGTLHYFTQKYMDKKMGHVVQPMEVEKAEENPADNAPLWYAILPVIPLSLILSFSSLWITTIKMNIVMAMFIGLFIGACCEFARKVFADIQTFFDGLGMQMANVITLIIAGQTFAQGLLSMGTIDSLIEGSKTLGFGPMAMMLVMVSIIVFSSIVMGSGNAPFFAFAALTPAVAAHTGLHPVLCGIHRTYLLPDYGGYRCILRHGQRFQLRPGKTYLHPDVRRFGCNPCHDFLLLLRRSLITKFFDSCRTLRQLFVFKKGLIPCISATATATL